MSTESLGIALAVREQDDRVATLRGRMAEQDLAAVAVASPEAVYYLTGLDHLGYFAFTLLIVPARGDLLVVTREMERPTVRAQIPHCRHLTFGEGTDPAAVVAAALGEVVSCDDIIGVEDSAMYFPPAIHRRIRAALPDIRWRDASPLVSRAMAVKSGAEIEQVRRAAAVSDAAMAAAIAAACAGVAEREVAAAVQH
ncbi:MAG: aminopeptidase P family N-terminal domain-containing protein, partial [Pseudonocardiaceae bacterium]